MLRRWSITGGLRLRVFRGTRRGDGIGELACALEELTNRLDGHLRFSERFAADVSHELAQPARLDPGLGGRWRSPRSPRIAPASTPASPPTSRASIR